MIIKKQLSIGMNITDPIAFYLDPDAPKRFLQNKLVNKCYKDVFILSIDNIVRMSECVVTSDGSPTYGVVHIEFIVTAIHYSYNEIINGCTVVYKDENMGTIDCSTDIASLIVTAGEYHKYIKIGQKISVRNQRAKYSIISSTISVGASLYIPTTISNVYKIELPLPAEAQDIVQQHLKSVLDIENKWIEKYKNTKAWTFFTDVLYPFKTDESSKVLKTVDIEKLLDLKGSLFVVNDSRLAVDSRMVAIYNNWQDLPEASKLIQSPSNINSAADLISIIDDYYSRLKIITEYIDIYSTPDIIKQHQNLWLIYKKNKK